MSGFNRSLKALAVVLAALVASPVHAAVDPVARGMAAQRVLKGAITACGTVTVSTPCLDLSQTWNASGVTFTGVRLNVTDTASASGSLLLDLQLAGSSKFSITKAGQVNFAAGQFFSNGNSVFNGTLQVGGTFSGTVVVTAPKTVSTLATCNSGLTGGRSFVSDATTTTFMSTVVGSGSNNVPVVCDGTNWKIGQNALRPANDNPPWADRLRALG